MSSSATADAPASSGVTAPDVAPAALPAARNGEPHVTQAPVSPDHRLPAPTDTSASRRPFYKRPVLIWLAIVLVVLAIVGFIFWLHGRHFQETDDAQLDGYVVPMAPQVSARVLAIHFNDNTFVHKGDLLVEIDPTDFKAGLAQARGAEAAAAGKAQEATAEVASARSSVSEAQAQLDAQQVNFENADRDLKRYKNLDERAKSQQSLDNATAAEKTAVAQVEQAKATLAVSQSRVASAEAASAAAAGSLQQAQADTHRAEVILGYCHVVAPMDGFVTMKNVDPGQYVTPANPLFTLVSPDVWVIANYKETQLDQMKVGQDVSISVDAFPDLDLRGKVQSFQAGTGSRFSIIPAENATGNYVKVVQRVPVKITLDRSSFNGRKLSPGLSVETSVRVLEGNF